MTFVKSVAEKFLIFCRVHHVKILWISVKWFFKKNSWIGWIQKNWIRKQNKVIWRVFFQNPIGEKLEKFWNFWRNKIDPKQVTLLLRLPQFCQQIKCYQSYKNHFIKRNWLFPEVLAYKANQTTHFLVHLYNRHFLLKSVRKTKKNWSAGFPMNKIAELLYSIYLALYKVLIGVVGVKSLLQELWQQRCSSAQSS